MVLGLATLCFVGKIQTTTQPRFLPAPWAEHSHREPEQVTVPIRVGLDSHEISTESTVWRYRAPVTAPASGRLLLVHGFRGDHHGMQLIADGLPEFEVLVPDLPGHGQSPSLRTQNGGRVEHSLELYAAFVEAVAHAMDLGEGDCLVGHSFGSTVCSAHCAASNRNWSGLVLSAPISNNIFRGRLLPGAALVDLYYRFTEVLPESAGNAVLRSTTVLEVMNLTLGVGWDAQLAAFVKDQHRQFFGGYSDRQTLLESYRASSRRTATQFAPAVSVPTLLLPGARDSLSTSDGLRALRDALPQGRLEVIRGAGHLVHYEKPAQLARAIRGFVSEVTSVGS